MDDTFHSGEYLIVDQVTYHFENPSRGDVIVFRYPKDPSKFFIKRVIGLPGDTITIENSTVTITNAENPDGFALDEPYIKSMQPAAPFSEILGNENTSSWETIAIKALTQEVGGSSKKKELSGEH